MFIAKGGKLPPGGTKPFGITSTSTAKWFSERELLARAGKRLQPISLIFHPLGSC